MVLVSRGVTEGLAGLSAELQSASLVIVAALLGVFFLQRFGDFVFARVLQSFSGVYLGRPKVMPVVT
ncbi:hypothetical protein [Deinococcus peraridilitoris]|uniref:Uncharacterized protein n=1 Tax=Deinococcus peraridilitoris (strain DSM 19664 / LMG 22246 / CIP 109416 / KR-200) TaxID=937777 RepID=L0A1F0_DEIPD|nr:hypothetical protein [Deinococcus peraridilitoris]AFZ67646.1 hypothetical protein Deipe_2157 [Deinococcus peraridilitoris DSM 19664]